MNYWLFLLIFYVVVAVLIFVYNFAMYIRCVYHEVRYRANIQNQTMHKNAKIREGVFSLCRLTGEPAPHSHCQDWLLNRYYTEENIIMFENMEGCFRYRAIHAWIWPLDFTQKLLAAIFKKKVKNKLILAVLSVARLFLEWIVFHIFEVLLAASGLDDKIAEFFRGL